MDSPDCSTSFLVESVTVPVYFSTSPQLVVEAIIPAGSGMAGAEPMADGDPGASLTLGRVRER
jgi:hypothetical protein